MKLTPLEAVYYAGLIAGASIAGLVLNYLHVPAHLAAHLGMPWGSIAHLMIVLCCGVPVAMLFERMYVKHQLRPPQDPHGPIA